GEGARRLSGGIRALGDGLELGEEASQPVQVDSARVPGSEDTQTDSIRAAVAMEEAIAIDPTNASRRDGIDLHYLVKVHGATEGIFDCRLDESIGPGLTNGGAIDVTHAASEDALERGRLLEPLVDQVLHAQAGPDGAFAGTWMVRTNKARSD